MRETATSKYLHKQAFLKVQPPWHERTMQNKDNFPKSPESPLDNKEIKPVKPK